MLDVASLRKISFTLIAALAVFTGLASVARAQTVVTSCGQLVDGDAILESDLDCSTYGETALRLGGGTLQMQGHSIIGNPALADPVYEYLGLPVVACDGLCRLVGPGIITGGGGGTTHGNSYGRGAAIEGFRVSLDDVTVEGNDGIGIAAAWLRMQNCTVRNNGAGIYAGQTSRITDSVVSDNRYYGITSQNGLGQLRLVRSSVTGNAAAGLVVAKGTLRDSVLTGNGTDDAACAVSPWYDEGCVDLYVYRRPTFVRTNCGTSYVWNPDEAGPTGLCTAD